MLRDGVHGVHVNVSYIGDTALHFSAMDNRDEVTKYLLQAGATVNMQDEDGRTPLHIATINNSFEVSQLLVNNGADIKLVNKDKRTPLEEASEGSNVKRMLLELSPP